MALQLNETEYSLLVTKVHVHVHFIPLYGEIVQSKTRNLFQTCVYHHEKNIRFYEIYGGLPQGGNVLVTQDHVCVIIVWDLRALVSRTVFILHKYAPSLC